VESNPPLVDCQTKSITAPVVSEKGLFTTICLNCDYYIPASRKKQVKNTQLAPFLATQNSYPNPPKCACNTGGIGVNYWRAGHIPLWCCWGE
jgi:hypothetical protein